MMLGQKVEIGLGDWEGKLEKKRERRGEKQEQTG